MVVEQAQAFHHLQDGLLLLVPVGLAQQYARQPVRTYPWIPVAGVTFPAKRLRATGCQHTAIQFLAHQVADAWAQLLQFAM